MPLALAIIGIVLVIVAIRGTEGDLFTLLTGDAAGWFKWAAAIVAVGALGYIPKLEAPSRVLLALVLIVIVLVNKGLFSTLSAVLTNPPAASPSVSPVPAALGDLPVKLNVSGGTGVIGKLVGGAASLGTGASSAATSGTGGLY